MQFDAPELSYEHVPEPTEDELREVDEAIARAEYLPDCEPQTWLQGVTFRSLAVKRAIEEVGLPNGPESTLAFLERMLAVKDAIADILGDFGALDVERFDQLAREWSYQQERVQLGKLPPYAVKTSTIKEMVTMLPIWIVASYLNVTAARVEQWLFPRTADLSVLRAAAEEYRNGTGIYAAAASVGICYDTLAQYCDFARIPRPVTRYKDGRRKRMTPEVRGRIKELAYTTDLTANEIRGKVRAEFVDAADLEYMAVYMTVYRVRGAGA